MDWVDWIILAVLVVSALAGLAQGFFRTVCSLLGLILGVLLADWNYPRVATVFQPMVRIQALADAIGFLLIALAVMVIANVIGGFMKKLFHWMGLGCLDTLGGALVGIVQGVLLVTVCILATVAFLPQTAWLTQARLPKEFFGALHLSTQVSPGDLSARVRAGLKSLEQESPQWLHEKNRGS